MRTSFPTLALALPMAAALVASAPASAQSKIGIAVVDVERAVGTSSAYATARTQMETTYKPQIDQFNARKAALDTDLNAKRTALETALKAAGGKPTPVIQTQYQAFQKAQQDAQAELQRIGQPVAMAQSYVEEQITAKLPDALKAAMAAAKVDLVLSPQGTVSFQPGVDITDQVVTQLNSLIPAASIVPPAGWRPGQQQQGAVAAPAAPAPAKPATTGR